jgi:hypothetical protein
VKVNLLGRIGSNPNLWHHCQMTSQDVPAEKRAEWRAWAVREFGKDDPNSVDVATDVVLKALIAGNSVEQAVATARATVTAHADSTAGKSDGAESVDLKLPVSDAEHLRGRVSLFRARNELHGTQYGTVWNFRVDSWDREGKPQPAVAVEMRALQFTGSVAEGDWIEISGPWKAGAIMRVSRLQNLTMNAPVTSGVSDGGSTGSRENTGVIGIIGRIIFSILVVIIVVGILIIFSFIITSWTGRR